MITIGSKIKRKKEKTEERESKKKIVPEGIAGIVRLIETDLDGTKKVRIGLTGIKGVGINFALGVANVAGIDPDCYLGALTDEQLKKIEDIIRNPLKYGFPEFMLNRRKDPVTGESRHVVASELVIVKKADIDRMKKIRCYKGIRHELGLPVRGQRTRGSFRKGTTAGVIKNKKMRAQASQKSSGKQSEKPGNKK